MICFENLLGKWRPLWVFLYPTIYPPSHTPPPHTISLSPHYDAIWLIFSLSLFPSTWRWQSLFSRLPTSLSLNFKILSKPTYLLYKNSDTLVPKIPTLVLLLGSHGLLLLDSPTQVLLHGSPIQVLLLDSPISPREFLNISWPFIKGRRLNLHLRLILRLF